MKKLCVKKISKKENEELYRSYKEDTRSRVRERSQIILFSNKGKTIKELVALFELTRQVICSLINNFNQYGVASLCDAQRSGCPEKLTDEAKKFVLKYLSKDSRSLNLILAELEDKFNIKISKRTLIRFIKKEKYVWKRMRKSLKNKRNEMAFKLFEIYLKTILKCEDEGFWDVYFFDEVTFNTIPSVPYAWIQKNENIELPSSKSRNISVLGFINRTNDFHPYIFECTVNSDVIIACIDDFIEKITKDTIVIIDNATTHTSIKFKDKIESWEDKGLYIIYLPTYSPELNIIEILWRFIKYKWIDLKAYQNYKSLIKEIERILINIGTKYTIDFKKESKKYC